MIDDVEAIEKRIEALREKARGEDFFGSISSDLNAAQMSLYKAQKRQFEQSIKRRARLQKKAP